jgi:hypothetical protein
MARKVPKDAAVAYATPAGHPDEIDHPGFYIVENANIEDKADVLGDEVVWVKDKPDPENGQPDPENNEGHWEYAGGGE